jgi:hypothetical protein
MKARKIAKKGVVRRDPAACSVFGCSCEAYTAPAVGTACATPGCGHAESQHTG